MQDTCVHDILHDVALQINAVDVNREYALHNQPLVLLNDKRSGPGGTPDRRMVKDVEALASNLSMLYPSANFTAVRFRDMPWAEQLHLLSRAKIFITTQGSSAFRLVFLPRGAVCVMVGAPEGNQTEWVSFHELDRWFPLSYIQFVRYTISIHNITEYTVQIMPGHWQPTDQKGRDNWWLYNADVRLDVQRLKMILDPILGTAT